MGTQVPTMPAIPSIAPTQSASGGVASSQDISQLLGPIASQAQAPLPSPYEIGRQVAEPRLHEQPFETNRPTDNKPIAPYVADVKRARRQNAVAGLANTIGKAGEMIQQKKNEQLKDKLVDVMKAKNNVTNAEKVLQQDPNNQMAKQVLDANKKQMDSILSDPKHQKQLAKALDISYIDPSKNKTPEIEAFKAATSEFDKAGPFKSDNPMEHTVSELANKPTAASQMAPQKPQLGQPQNQHPTIQQAQSATPYADQALKKDSQEIEANPQYAAALKQKEVAQKQMAAIIPKLVEAESKAQIQAVKDGNVAAKEQFKSAVDLQRDSFKAVAAADRLDSSNKAAMQRVAARNATQFSTTLMRVNAELKIAADKRLDKQQQEKIKANSLENVNKTIATITTTITNDDKAIGDAVAAKASPQEIEALKVQKDLDIRAKSSYLDLRQKKFEIGLDKEASPSASGVITNGIESGATKQPVEAAGESESDEDDSDTDSDTYGTN